MIEGEILRLCRKKRGLTMRELSRKSGVSPSHISQVERGNSDISFTLFVRLLAALDFEFLIMEKRELQ